MTARAEVAPTPQTAKKLRHDVVERLHRDGRLAPEHLRAANEIRRLWEAFGRGMAPMAARLDSPRQTHPTGLYRDPVDRLSHGEEIAWRNRYRPWAREAAQARQLGLVHAIVVDNSGLRAAERGLRLRNGQALPMLRAALERYAVIAGWRAANFA